MTTILLMQRGLSENSSRLQATYHQFLRNISSVCYSLIRKDTVLGLVYDDISVGAVSGITAATILDVPVARIFAPSDK